MSYAATLSLRTLHGPRGVRALLLLLAAAVATALLTAGSAAARSLQQVRNAGSLRVGVVVAAPWVVRNAAGELDGFEVDVAEQLAADLEVEPEFVVYRFDELVPAIESGEVDIVIASLTITPERALHVNFSRSYVSGGVAIATNTATTAEVTQFQDLNDPDFNIGAIADTAGAQIAGGMLPDARLVEFDDAEDAADALLTGDIDAFLDEQPAPTYLALNYPGLIDLPIGRPLLETRSGFAIAKGDADFLAFLNAWLDAREADTFLPSTHRYWFESLRWQER